MKLIKLFEFKLIQNVFWFCSLFIVAFVSMLSRLFCPVKVQSSCACGVNTKSALLLHDPTPEF